MRYTYGEEQILALLYSLRGVEGSGASVPVREGGRKYGVVHVQKESILRRKKSRLTSKKYFLSQTPLLREMKAIP